MWTGDFICDCICKFSFDLLHIIGIPYRLATIKFNFGVNGEQPSNVSEKFHGLTQFPNHVKNDTIFQSLLYGF